VLLVVLIKAALFPLSTAQYKSMAKMRKFQPRIAQLKERYGEDRQQFQTAMMELYKKEKINPVGGCLPVLLQMPVFLALYWVLLESVELRQAPWILWIQDLTARDPYFILPILNMLVTWATQRLTPMAGMDPMQQKMMQFMPLVFGVLFAFFPAGLVLYWVTNGSLGLLQQWWLTRRYAEAPAKA
jgi:YidC/Oxa1 family membrane protein insertase